MKTLTAAVLICFCFSAIPTRASQTAQARLYCLSVKLNDGRDEYGNTTKLTSTGGFDAGLTELRSGQDPSIELQFPTTEGYLSAIYVYSSRIGNYSGYVNIDIQPHTDDNVNRYPDFFEVTQGVTNYVWPYGLIDIYGYNTFYSRTVTWDRPAGSTTGTCVIDFNNRPYLGTFRHTFEILEYTGTIAYTPAADVVSGTIHLVQTGHPTNVVDGPVQFEKVADSADHQIRILPGSWSGTLLSTFYTYTNHVFSRDPLFWRSNYAGFIEFSDGDPWTLEPYCLWVLSITDPNDSDNNGVPDIADKAAIQPPPRAPVLSLAPAAGGLELTIRGDVQHTHLVQEAVAPDAVSWNTIQTLALATDPQTITLALPGSNKFWRVVAQ